MGDSLLFHAASAGGADALHDAVAASFEVGNRGDDEHLVSFTAGRGELSALVAVEPSGQWWRADADEDQLRYADGRPDEETQGAYVELVRVLLAAAPPYVGFAVYPFGPSGPPSVPGSPPFALPDVGPMLFLSERYLGDNPPVGRLRDVAGYRTEDVADGLLLRVEGDLLRTGEDGEDGEDDEDDEFDDLRRCLGLPGAS